MTEILIEDFKHPTHTWIAKNDPVMGGKSTGTVTLADGLAIFDGQVVNVPFLQAPGFITMETRRGVWPDVSACQGLVVRMRATEPYDGYRLSFGNVHVPGGRFAYGYKANFAVNNTFADVYLPFDQFTAKWDDATGDAIVTCAENARYCPTTQSLQNLQTLIFWGEGVAGKVHLEIASIRGAHCGEALSVNYSTTSRRLSWVLSSWTWGPLAVCVVAALVAIVVKRIVTTVRKRAQYSTLQRESLEIQV